MLYICIPTHNEAQTVGLLLWRLRKVFQEYSRDYEVVVYDDASSDATPETLASYAEVLPLTVLRAPERRGYARGLEECCRAAVGRTRYPRRDAMIVMQADFTDSPEQIPEMVKRFEGGADVVAADRVTDSAAPAAVQRLRLLASWLFGREARKYGISDPCGGFRLYRISVIRDLLRGREPGKLLAANGWAANAELFMLAAAHARRVERTETAPRYDIRERASRVSLVREAAAMVRFGRASRRIAEAPR